MNQEPKMLSIEEIQSAVNFDENSELFTKAIDILHKEITRGSFEFTEEEREVLEEVYSKMEF